MNLQRELLQFKAKTERCFLMSLLSRKSKWLDKNTRNLDEFCLCRKLVREVPVATLDSWRLSGLNNHGYKYKYELPKSLGCSCY